MSRSSGRLPARSRALALLGLLAGLLAAGPAAAGGREFDLGAAGTLWLPVPSTWTVTPERREGPIPTWEIAPPDAGGAILLVTPTWGRLQDRAVDLRFQLAQEMEQAHRESLAAAEDAGRPAPEKPEMFLQEGPAAKVAWYLAVDPVATGEPGDFERMVRALVDVGDLRLSATLLHHAPDDELVQAALWLLANARHEAIRRAAAEQRLRLGERPWVLVLPVAGFDLDPPMVREDHGGVALSGTHPRSGLIVSAFLERTEEERDAAAWRDVQRRRVSQAPFTVSGVATGELEGHPALQYDVKQAAGERIDQRHVHAYLARDDVWIDVHLSKPGFSKGEEHLFTDFLAAVRLERVETAPR